MKKKDYHKSSYPTPYRLKSKEGKKRTLKKIIIKFSFFIILTFIIFFIYLMFFSNYLLIEENNISWQSGGELTIDSEGKHEFYNSLTKNKKLLFIPTNHLFFFDKNLVKEYLKNRHNLKIVTINKKFPHFLNIYYEIKMPVFIWLEKQESYEDYYLVNELGQVIEQIKLSTFEQELPFISRNTTTEVIIGQYLIKEELVNFIQNLLAKIKRLEFAWRIIKTEFINNQVPTVIMITNEGWQIYFNANLDIDSQLIKLKRILEQKDFDRTKLKYIDLQIFNKVFYK